MCIFFQQVLQSQAWWLLGRLGYRLRGAMTVMLFEKSLRLEQSEMSAIGIGKIVNLAEVDCMQLMWSMYVRAWCAVGMELACFLTNNNKAVGGSAADQNPRPTNLISS